VIVSDSKSKRGHEMTFDLLKARLCSLMNLGLPINNLVQIEDPEDLPLQFQTIKLMHLNALKSTQKIIIIVTKNILINYGFEGDFLEVAVKIHIVYCESLPVKY
jgi:hypothetical protein